MTRKVITVMLTVSCFAICILCSREKPDEFPVLTGPYLGQKPPGLTAEIFAPGIVSTDANEIMYGFFNDNSLFIYERSTPDFEKDWIYVPVYRTEIKNGVWTEPQKSTTTGRPWFYEYSDAPEGTVFFFPWRKNLDGSGPLRDIDLWKTVKIPDGWAPRRLGYPVNTNAFDSWPSVSQEKTLYFFSTREGGFGKSDLYRSFPDKNEYNVVENLGNIINSPYNDHDPFIAPDESYLLWCSDKPGGHGINDLYVAFQKRSGEWTRPYNLGDTINTPADETRPYVTPDGKYIFFVTDTDANFDIYWVDAGIIEILKQEALRKMP